MFLVIAADDDLITTEFYANEAIFMKMMMVMRMTMSVDNNIG
jgi:hypothetical protein